MKKWAVITLLTFFSLTKTPVFAQNQDLSVNTKADIPTILELAIEQSGQSELRFGNLHPSALQTTEAGPVTVIIHVTCNIGDSYQVTQSISNALENTEGKEIDSENLKFTSVSLKTKGTVVSQPTPVTKSAQIIFVSDASGSSDTIKAEYTLTVPASQAPGDYSAIFTYTVSTL